ncbi:hypothetical protein COW80_00525 [Candidatus Beckwithbacteria bacterium CG22_combo_CG10-13_8_21_14_all_01_47_9]|uniref:Uncharacterized protein n=3 Tax=Candidatus Beckwithiibacteriota TaxID=1752726 RepID=A0A2H0E1U8_9BACT|nr:MAG: hypothetical protein COX09_05140 [Candidatus Beckwithbacteria bacterium CG23_combo_of_CG06-09_8_20_14_all_47_9]PIP88405.1 MAG: hypothetical protein COW80_00525 [Candidatus Beckwithbacteria bacterium CG22_combo_CG10-13_8_21_14_all_01_47_9]PJA23386.1 MAG: hypothetical protein COX59_00175 [Candidatus Beckwithbacteria bacterium CG_4_10_14_0_2_um_filter_47_25]
MRPRRKNYLPTLILIVILWSLLGLMLFFVEPELVKNILLPGLYLPFFLLFFPAGFFSLAVILGNTRRGLLVTIGLTCWLILRLYQLDNGLNLLLILGILIVADRYFN